MDKVVVAVLGCDRPGIIAAVSQVLFEEGCNIEDVSQTILQTEFAGIFIATRPDDRDEEALRAALHSRLGPMGLPVLLKPMEEESGSPQLQSEPFVITTVGPDRPGLVAGVTGVLAARGVNITNLKAVFRGVRNPSRNIMFYEIDIPVGVNQGDLRAALFEKARELGLDISFQHRDIFEELHRI